LNKKRELFFGFAVFLVVAFLSLTITGGYTVLDCCAALAITVLIKTRSKAYPASGRHITSSVPKKTERAESLSIHRRIF
jgi:hypothetical protein